MAIFVNLLRSTQKEGDLLSKVAALASGERPSEVYERRSDYFGATEDGALLYAMPEKLFELAVMRSSLASIGVGVRQGVGASTIFHRLWWELTPQSLMADERRRWPFMAHGTSYSPFYKSSYFVFKWYTRGMEAKADVLRRYPYLKGNYGLKIQSEEVFFQPGLCYGKRTTNFSVQVMPRGHLFSQEGTAIHLDRRQIDVWVLLAILNSKVVSYWLSQVCAQHKVYNYVQALPMPVRFDDRLGRLSREAWSVARELDWTNEQGNAFLLPEVLLRRGGHIDQDRLKKRLGAIQAEIDAIVFDLYELGPTDREAICGGGEYAGAGGGLDVETEELEEFDFNAGEPSLLDTRESLLSWCAGVVFGRFDLCLANGERHFPAEPDPFDPLPIQSPGMLPPGQEPFHRYEGVLVDDPGHLHDVARLIEEVLVRVECYGTEDVRRYIQREFFPAHLQRYSRGRRKAPIYWPLATSSGSYTLWIYYPSLTSQTLYSAVNDLVEPKLVQVAADVDALRTKAGARTRNEEKSFEVLQAFADELIELRDTLLRIAQTYQPNRDDGVQISAAPLWPLFRHKPWQKVLRDTWSKLQRGEYDWTHLAMNYWPERVREKCNSDKSLAIAHGLEHLYVEPQMQAKKTRGRKNARGDE